MHQFNSRIAAASATRHVELLDELDALGISIGKTADSFIWSMWTKLSEMPEHSRYGFIVELIHKHYEQVYQRLFKLFDQLAVKQHLAATMNIARHLPTPVLRTFAEITGPLMEELGQVVVSLQRLKPHIVDRTKRLREPAYQRLPEAEQRRIFRDLLLPKLEKNVVQRIIFGTNPQETLHRITQETRLADPLKIANLVTQGISAGKNRVEISRELRPLLHGNKSSAMRVARTEGARVANHANMLAFDELGEMVVGFQVHAVLDERTRPWHATRNGQIYYKHPTGDQKGLFQMPHPPIEPADPNERPGDAPKIAFNCRCFLSPVFADLETGKPALEVTNAEGRIIPDPLTYDEWFTQASEPLRRKSVGVRRYQAVRQQEVKRGRKPDYFDFISPRTGNLLSLDYLSNESETARLKRRTRLMRVFSERREWKKNVLLTGSA